MMYSRMVGGDGEVLKTPFDHLPMNRWPYDFCTILNLKRHYDNIDREISLKDDFPQPTLKTKKSQKGMEAWRNWIKGQEEKKRRKDPNKAEVKELWEYFAPGHIVVFDYYSPPVYIKWECLETNILMTFEELTNARRQQYSNNRKTKKRD